MGEVVLTTAGAAHVAASDCFERDADGAVRCEGVALSAIADAVGTPTYVYSAASIRTQYAKLTTALGPVRHRVHYSVKANSNLAVLALLRTLGAGVDIVSGGELVRALRAGFTGADVVFSGVGKTADEIADALRADVRFINVESEAELRAISAIAARLGVVARIALRVNPEVTVDTPHAYTRTGERGNKFGIGVDDARAVARLARELPAIALVGLDMHIGSQVSTLEPYVLGLERLVALVHELRADGAGDLRVLDLGGGFAVTYEREVESDLTGFADVITDRLAGEHLEIVVEPGRYLVGNAGALVTRVLYRKESGGKRFVIADAGMTELIRPSHYNAYHRIEPVGAPRGRTVADVVGPVCESGDFFALDREMADVAAGDLLVVHSAGAYGYAMASNYNTRPRPAEVLVDGDRWAVVTERETYDDLLRRESVNPNWRQG